MNMTEKFEHDRKDHTDKHERWNLTENVLQQRTLTGEYDRNYNSQYPFQMILSIYRYPQGFDFRSRSPSFETQHGVRMLV